MSRPKSRPLEIAERLAQQVRDHAAANPEDWWQIPPPDSVLDEARASMDALERPVVVFEVNGSEPAEGGALDLEQEDLDVTCWGLTNDSESPQRAGLELLADLRRALIGNRQMTDGTGSDWLTCGQLIDRGFTIACDFNEAGAGQALIEYRLRVRYQWTPETA